MSTSSICGVRTPLLSSPALYHAQATAKQRHRITELLFACTRLLVSAALQMSTFHHPTLNATLIGLQNRTHGVDIKHYRGIKYASIAKRFGESQLAENWDGLDLDCTRFGYVYAVFWSASANLAGQAGLSTKLCRGRTLIAGAFGSKAGSRRYERIRLLEHQCLGTCWDGERPPASFCVDSWYVEVYSCYVVLS